MVIDLVVTLTDDGYTGDVPSVNGCECWASDEEEVITKSLEMVSFYLNLTPKDIIVDKARREGKRTIYKLVFNK